VSALILGSCALGFARYQFWLASPAASQGTWFTQPWPLDNDIRSVARVVAFFGLAGVICGAVGIVYGRILVKRAAADLMRDKRGEKRDVGQKSDRNSGEGGER
jgi:hypothetical protein